MKKVAILFAVLLSSISLSFAQTAVPTLYGDVDPEGNTECVSLSYNLRLGSRDASTNGEVSMLQDYLGISPPTGYFGRATLAKVKEFQVSNGLLNSGYVGPLTRTKIKELSCNGQSVGVVPGATNPGQVVGNPPVPVNSFRVERSASNPLEVKAYFYLGSSCSNYTLDWGDGMSSGFILPPHMTCTQVVPTEPVIKTHTYSRAGTYTVKFQTGGYPQQSASIAVGNSSACPDGMPPTGDGCIIKCPNGTTVVGNQPCPTTPTCATPGTVPLCPGTSTRVPYNSQTCSWDWNACLTIPTSNSPQVRFIENPTLKLEYDSAGKESVLVGRTVVEITAGATDVLIPRQSSALTLTNQNGDSIYVSSYSGSAEIVSGDASNVPGEGRIKIPTGRSAKIAFYAKVQSGNLFAGGYLVSLKQILYSTGSYEGPGIITIEVPHNKSNMVSVIGEISPYISSVTADATPQTNVTIKGVRFHSTSNVVTIGNVSRTLPSIANGLYINTTLQDFGLVAGKDYIVQVTHPTTGASNRFTLVTSAPTTGQATASIVGTPTLRLAYALGATGGEASLDASFVVDVKAGSEKITINKNGFYHNDWSARTFFVSLKQQSQTAVAMPAPEPIDIKVNILEMGATVPMGDTYTIQPGQTVRFIVNQSWNPKRMFAGSYTSSISLQGSSGEFLPANQTNAIPVLGEVSPYISMVTVDADGLVRVTGQRFDLQGNRFMVDGTIAIESMKGDATTGFIDTRALGLANGGHFLQIKNTEKGDSNSYYFVANNMASLPPTVSATANQVTTLRAGGRYQLFSIKVDNLTRSNPLNSFVLTLDAPGSGVFKQIEILDANTGTQLAVKSGLAGYLKFDAAGEYAGTKEFSVVATMEPTFASYYTNTQVQAVFDGIIVGGQTITPTGGRVFGPKASLSNIAIPTGDPICPDGRLMVNGVCPPPTLSPTSLNPSSFQVLASSVRALESNYLGATGGTVALSASSILSPASTAETMSFTGLKRGANEIRVSHLKKILNTISPSVSVGCANLSTTNTLYGPTTEECVKVFQTLNELEPTGAVDAQTNQALNRVIAR